MSLPEKIGYLFPGQGAQYVGMGKDLYERFAEAKSVFDQADNLLGYAVSKICFEGPEEELTRTRHAQPAIFVMSLAALAVLKNKCPDLKPSWVAGLSLGEFTALTAAGSISFEDGMRLVQKRADAMGECASKYKGTMASLLGLNREQCEEVAQEAGCEVANLNASNQIVLSGSIGSIEKACALAEQKGAKRVIPLKVGGAFHSSLMGEARETLKRALTHTEIQAPQAVFIPNAKAQKVSDPDEIRELLALQLTSPVRWVETMEQSAQENIGFFLEVGPGKVLKGLARKARSGIEVEPCGTVEDFEKLEKRLQAV